MLTYVLGAACTMSAAVLLWQLLVKVRGPAYAVVALLAALCITFYNGRLYYYNHNTLSRMTYVTNNYPPAKNPMLYGVEKTSKYIEITRACSQARLEALGW